MKSTFFKGDNQYLVFGKPITSITFPDDYDVRLYFAELPSNIVRGHHIIVTTGRFKNMKHFLSKFAGNDILLMSMTINYMEEHSAEQDPFIIRYAIITEHLKRVSDFYTTGEYVDA